MSNSLSLLSIVLVLQLFNSQIGLSQIGTEDLDFSDLKGLWTTVKHQVSDGEGFYEPLQSGSEILFGDDSFEWICYPCSGYRWKVHSTLRNDTLTYYAESGYEGMYVLSFIGDTLVLHNPNGREENYTEEEYTYLLKVEADSNIIENLVNQNTNWDCINSKWTSNEANKTIVYGVEIPKEIEFINFESELFYVEDQKIYLKSNKAAIFRISKMEWWGLNENEIYGNLVLTQINNKSKRPIQLNYSSLKKRLF